MLRAVASTLLLMQLAHTSAHAGGGNYEPPRPPRISAPTRDAKAFYVEFRARKESGGYGHSYVTLGTFNGAGRSRQTVVAGFTPKGPDDDFLGGLALPVSGSVGLTKSDLVRRPDVTFRVRISREQYNVAVRRIHGLRRNWTTYSLLGQNCNDFTGQVAHSIGLRTPMAGARLPVGYISELRSLNSR